MACSQKHAACVRKSCPIPPGVVGCAVVRSGSPLGTNKRRTNKRGAALAISEGYPHGIVWDTTDMVTIESDVRSVLDRAMQPSTKGIWISGPEAK